MGKLSFSLLKSKTIWGAVLAILGWLFSPETLAVIPSEAIASVMQAIGALLAAIGLRNAVATNGVASTPDRAIEANGAEP